MQWLSLSSAWYGVSLLLILAMYLFKRVYMPKYISSHMLWRKVLREQEANKPWQMLKNQLLLWLQLLIAACIVIALMQPNLLKVMATEEQVIVVIDRSASMTSTLSDQQQITLLEHVKAEAIKWVKDHAGNAKLFVIVNGDFPEIIVGVDTKKSEVIQAISAIEPYYGISDDSTTLSLARVIAEQSEHSMIRIYGDQSFINKAEVHADSASLANEHYETVSSPASIGIRHFTISAPQEEQRVVAYATIYHPESWQEQLEVSFTAYNEKHMPIGTAAVHDVKQQLQYSTITSEYLPAASYYKAEIMSSEADGNKLDNVAYQFGSGIKKIEALLISNGNLFLEKALQLMNVKVTKVTANEEPPVLDEQSHYQFIIVDGNLELLADKENWMRLLAHSPLWIIDHPNDEQALSATANNIEIVEHPITQYLNFDDVYISKFQRLKPEELSIGQPVVLYDSIPAIVAGYENNLPLVRFTFALSDSDLPLRAQFPVLVMQSIQYLTSGASNYMGDMMAGSLMQAPYAPEAVQASWRLIEAISSVMNDERKGQNEVRIAIDAQATVYAPSLPGLYEWIEYDSNDEIIQVSLANIIYDVNELQLAQMNRQAADHEQENAAAVVKSPITTHISLLSWIMAITLLLLITEWEVYRRGL